MLLTGADVADAASSWGKSEGNPLVRTGSRFSYGSLAIKFGGLAGSLAAQRYILHKNPQYAPLLTTANLAATATLSVIAVHNMHISAAH